MAVQPAFELIGHEGEFRLPGGRALYEGVMFNDASARSERVRLARLETGGGGIRQVQRWVDWDQPVEVVRDFTAEWEEERREELGRLDDADPQGGLVR